MLDGIDEGGEFKPRIEHFVTTFLVRQRISLIATTRPEGYTKALYEGNFERFSLAPLDRPQQVGGGQKLTNLPLLRRDVTRWLQRGLSPLASGSRSLRRVGVHCVRLAR